MSEFFQFIRFSDNGAKHERVAVGFESEVARGARKLVEAGEWGVHRNELLAAIPSLARAGIGLDFFAHPLYDGIIDARPEWARLIPEQEVKVLEGVGNA